jgi:acyl carrier protein
MLEERIRNLICEVADREKSIADDADLELDSIEFIDVVVAIEKEFRIKFNEYDLRMDNFMTIINFVDYVEIACKN